MAIIKSIGVGKARGSVGEFTYSTVEGRTIARSKPAFVSNPNTALQQTQRSKMSDIVWVWSAIGQRFAKLWTKRKKYNSPYNAFVSKNIMGENTFSVDRDLNEYSLSVGFVLGEGSYSGDNLKFAFEEGTLGVSLNSPSPLEAVIKAGDRVGFIQLGVNNTFLQEDIHVLSESDVISLKNNEAVLFADENEDVRNMLPYWISQDGQKSTSVIVSKL